MNVVHDTHFGFLVFFCINKVSFYVKCLIMWRYLWISAFPCIIILLNKIEVQKCNHIHFLFHVFLIYMYMLFTTFCSEFHWCIHVLLLLQALFVRMRRMGSHTRYSRSAWRVSGVPRRTSGTCTDATATSTTSRWSWQKRWGKFCNFFMENSFISLRCWNLKSFLSKKLHLYN